MLPVELTKLPLLEKLFLDNNKLTVLPPELGVLKNLKVLTADYNMLVSVPGKVGTHAFLYTIYYFIRLRRCSLFRFKNCSIACDTVSCLNITQLN